MSAEVQQGLGAGLELAHVRFYEVGARAVEDEGSKTSSRSEGADTDQEPTTDVKVRVKNTENRIASRISVDFADSEVTARIDVAAFFKISASDGRSDLAETIAQESVLVLVPYIRESLADVTRRITGKPVLLGTVRPSDLTPLGVATE